MPSVDALIASFHARRERQDALRHARCTACGRSKSRDAFDRRADGSLRKTCLACCERRKVWAEQRKAIADAKVEHTKVSVHERMTVVGKHCPRCFGMPWRVEGEKCKRCKLGHADEKRSVDDFGALRSSAAMLVEEA